MDYCSVGDGARFWIGNRLNLCFRGSTGSYGMSIEPWDIGSEELEVIERIGLTADSDYIELFGRNGSDMADDFYLGSRFGAYVTVDFSHEDQDCEFNTAVVEALFSGAESGYHKVDLIQAARIIVNRTPDAFILFTVNGCDGGEYVLRCQRKD